MVVPSQKPSESQSVEGLRQQLSSAAADTRLVAIAGLIDRPQVEFHADLAARLEDNDPSVVELSVVALTQLGAVAASDLATALDTSLPIQARRAAASGLAQLGPVDEAVLPSLRDALDSDDPILQELAALALSRNGAAATGYLEDAMTSVRPETRFWATRALGWIGTEAKVCGPTLEQCLEAADTRTRLAACVALANVTEQTEKPLSILLQAAKHSDPEKRQLAAENLGQLQPTAEPAIICLMEMLGDGQAAVVCQAALGLARSRTRAPEVLQGLGQLLVHEAPPVRKYALMALASWGQEAMEALPAVERLVDDEDEQVAAMAAACVDKIAYIEPPSDLQP